MVTQENQVQRVTSLPALQKAGDWIAVYTCSRWDLISYSGSVVHTVQRPRALLPDFCVSPRSAFGNIFLLSTANCQETVMKPVYLRKLAVTWQLECVKTCYMTEGMPHPQHQLLSRVVVASCSGFVLLPCDEYDLSPRPWTKFTKFRFLLFTGCVLYQNNSNKLSWLC